MGSQIKRIASWLPVKFFDREISEISYSNPDDKLSRKLLIRSIETLTGQPKLQKIYSEYKKDRKDDDNFWQSAINCLKLSIYFDARQLDQIPKTGPLVIVANHPYGVLDGIAIGYMLSRIRGDFKLLAHAALGKADGLRPYLFPIEFDGDSSVVRSNVISKRQATDHLKDGGAIILFPAGRVSTAEKVFDRATDAPWKRFAGKLILSSNATVVPVFFEGQNSWVFHFVSKINESLREAFLLREVAKNIGGSVTAHIGAPETVADVAIENDRQAVIDHFRDAVYCLDPMVQENAG